ncbi:MAG: N-formylglutamate amidohydrolase [Rhodospirillaceae bacterium]|nr:MAG: N-formylglutamate amidohydrolase [Rhodospirillaceae bacterium]
MSNTINSMSEKIGPGCLSNQKGSGPLLCVDEPLPFEIYNGQGPAPLVIVSDHASNVVPKKLDHLGLSSEHFDRHIAYDIGADCITRCLADRLDARAVLAKYSRLVVDVNRDPDDLGCMPQISDETLIPGNQDLSPTRHAQRIAEIHTPYHKAISGEISTITARDGRPPALFSIHSFTPSMNGADRIWDVGVLWNKDPRMSSALMEHLGRWDGLHVGDNQPYSGTEWAYTIDTHGTDVGLANCAIEIRQDHCGTIEEATHWADILADALRHILTLDNLHELQKY